MSCKISGKKLSPGHAAHNSLITDFDKLIVLVLVALFKQG